MKRLAVLLLLCFAGTSKAQTCNAVNGVTPGLEVKLTGNAVLANSVQMGGNDTLGFINGTGYNASVTTVQTSNLSGDTVGGQIVQLIGSTQNSSEVTAGGIYYQLIQHSNSHIPAVNDHMYLLELDKQPNGTYNLNVNNYESVNWNNQYRLYTKYTATGVTIPYYYQIVYTPSTGLLQFQSSSNGTSWYTMFSEAGASSPNAFSTGFYTYTGVGGYPAQSGETQMSVNNVTTGTLELPTLNVTDTSFALPMIQAATQELGIGFDPVSGTAIPSAGCSVFPGTVSFTNEMQFYQSGSVIDTETATQNYSTCSQQSTCTFSFNAPLNYPSSQYVEEITHGYQYYMGITLSANTVGWNTGYLVEHTIIWPAVP